MGKKRGNEESGSRADSSYDEELLCANWNPVLDLIEWSCAKSFDDVSRDRGKDLSDSDIDAFLNRIYSLGG